MFYPSLSGFLDTLDQRIIFVIESQSLASIPACFIPVSVASWTPLTKGSYLSLKVKVWRLFPHVLSQSQWLPGHP